MSGPDGTKAGCQIFNIMPGHPAGKAVVNLVSYSSVQRCMGIKLTCSNHHVESILDHLNQVIYILRVMLTVSIHEYQGIAIGISCSGFWNVCFFGGTFGDYCSDLD